MTQTLRDKNNPSLTLRFTEIQKEPLHLLLDTEIPFPKEVTEKVDREWENNRQAGDEDEMRCVVVDKFERNGREVFIQAKIRYRYLSAWNAYISGKGPKIPGLGPFEYANPIGKIALLPTKEHPDGVIGFGLMHAIENHNIPERLSGIGGYMDPNDMTKVTLPSGNRAVVQIKKGTHFDLTQLFDQGQLNLRALYQLVNQKQLAHMLNMLDEYEQNGQSFMTPSRHCIQREGREEVGIISTPSHPTTKAELVHTDPFGNKTILENWYGYDLYPKNAFTPEQILNQFKQYDKQLVESRGEREFTRLVLLNRVDFSPITKEDRPILVNLPKRPTVDPILHAEIQYQARKRFGLPIPFYTQTQTRSTKPSTRISKKVKKALATAAHQQPFTIHWTNRDVRDRG